MNADAKLKVAICLALAWLSLPVLAESTIVRTAGSAQGGAFSLARFSIDGGAGEMAGGMYELRGSLGQADADPLQPSIADGFQLTGGFWPGVGSSPAPPEALFANGFE